MQISKITKNFWFFFTSTKSWNLQINLILVHRIKINNILLQYRKYFLSTKIKLSWNISYYTKCIHFQFHKQKIFQLFLFVWLFIFVGFFMSNWKIFITTTFFLALFLLSECQHLCLKFCFLDYLPFITTQKIDFYVTAIKIDKNRLL